ncbi:hypothetical protein [Pseudomonas mediterranea]
MTDYTELKRLAEGCRDEVIRSHGWAGMIEDAGLLGRDETFLKECSPDVVLTLIDDLDQARNGMKYACAMRLKKEIERLQSELDKAIEFQPIGEACLANRDTLRESLGLKRGENLHEHVEALRKDAERYRWLRDNSESVHQFYLSTPIWFTGVKFSKENVDSTIDAAMREEPQS